MNESPLKVSFFLNFSLQLKVLPSRSCVRLELSPPCLVWPAKLAVSPARLVPTAGRRVSRPPLHPALRVSLCVFFMTKQCSMEHLDEVARIFAPLKRCTVFLRQATGVLLLRLFPQRSPAPPATSACRVVWLRSAVHPDSIRTEINRQPARSARRVGGLLPPDHRANEGKMHTFLLLWLTFAL